MLKSFTVRVVIRGKHIFIINPHPTPPFPKGIIAEGRLVWNTKARKWIIAKKGLIKPLSTLAAVRMVLKLLIY